MLMPEIAPYSLERLLVGVAEASVKLMQPRDFNQVLQEAVQIMGTSAAVDRCYIFTINTHEGHRLVCQIVEWADATVSEQISNTTLAKLDYETYRDVFEQLDQKKYVAGQVQAYPSPFRELMEAQEILSFLFIPIKVDDQTWGFIGYDACKEMRIWDNAEIDALQILASAIGVFIGNNRLKIALENKNKQFDLAIKGSKDGIWDIDLRTGETYVSQTWLDIFGYTSKEEPWTYADWMALVHPADQMWMQANLDTFIAGATGTNDLEYRMLHAKGHYVWVLSRSAIEADAEGRAVRIAGSDTDITERKIHEQILAQNERQYKNLVNNLSEVVFEVDADGQLVFLNNAWEGLTGFTVQESIGQRGSVFFDPSMETKIPALVEQLDANLGAFTTTEVKYRHKLGHLVWASIKAKRSFNQAGELLGTTGTITNITEQKMAAEELRLSESKYRLISENITDIITQHNDKGVIMFASASIKELLNYEPADILGHVPFDFIHPDEMGYIQENAYAKLLDGTEKIRVQYRVRHKNGHYVWVESLTKFIRAADGQQVLAIQVSTRDISANKKAEQEISRAVEKEKELMELRSRFIMMASHEFRTPLATIQSSLDILRLYLSNADQSLKKRCDKHFDKMGKEIHRVSDLMNDVLLLGKLEAGKTPVNLQATDLSQLIETVLKQHFGIESNMRQPQFIRPLVAQKTRIDEQLISHCVINLLSNALKFSMGKPAPSIQLAYTRKRTIIKVHDFGIGISQVDKKRLFEPFFRGKNAQTTVGTGLGLVVVKEFVHLHGGKIFCKSKVGVETTFTIELKNE